jgi:hypothetical protein
MEGKKMKNLLRIKNVGFAIFLLIAIVVNAQEAELLL